MKKSRSSESKTITALVPLDELVPYWRNPRRITEEAVDAVAESIRKFGYQQPILIDEEKVIIAGHTRYAALRRLGVEAVEVRIIQGLSPAQVKQLRLIDNRTSELGSWDFTKLMEELNTMDDDLIVRFFPEIAGVILGTEAQHETSSFDVQPMAEVESRTPDSVEFVCPACFHIWVQEVSMPQIRRGLIESVKVKEKSV